MRKKFRVFAVIIAATLVLSGCNWLEYKIGSLKEQFVGRELTIQTYDENSQMIDRVQGKSVSIEADEKFYAKEKLVMLATKAFGMGIDINDIELVVHFAPTGNVCDYVQEIGRAARREDLKGEAKYYYNAKDFKHINRLHGLSTIQHYQLIKVIEKINELYQQSLQSGKRKDFTKKKLEMK